jgi:hypothetical protein
MVLAVLDAGTDDDRVERLRVGTVADQRLDLGLLAALDGLRLLTPESVDEMFRPLWEFNGVNGATYEAESGDPGGAFFCRYGLATQTLATPRPVCDDDGWGDGVERVGHGGDAYGLVSGLWIDRAGGTGVAYFITGGDLTRKGQRSAFYAVEEELLDR